MADRETTRRGKAAADQLSGSGRTANVFDTHGNDHLRDHVGRAQAAQGQEEAGSMGSRLLGNQMASSVAPDRAMQEALMWLDQMKTAPRKITEQLSSTASHDDKVMVMLEQMVLDLPPATIVALSVADLSSITSGMVMSSDAERAIDQASPEVQELGGFAPVLFQLLSDALRRTGPERIVGDPDKDEKERVDPFQLKEAIGEVIRFMRLGAALM
jgi:hypothetical protein